MTAIPVNYQLLHEEAIAPEYGTDKSAGFDLAIPQDIVIYPGETKAVRLGIVVQAPANHFILVVPRSSTQKKWGLSLGNTVGIIDEDYCGPEDELILMLTMKRVDFPFAEDAPKLQTIPAGTRLAQGIFIPYTRADFVLNTEAIGENRGGWGSTG